MRLIRASSFLVSFKMPPASGQLRLAGAGFARADVEVVPLATGPGAFDLVAGLTVPRRIAVARHEVVQGAAALVGVEPIKSFRLEGFLQNFHGIHGISFRGPGLRLDRLIV